MVVKACFKKLKYMKNIETKWLVFLSFRKKVICFAWSLCSCRKHLSKQALQTCSALPEWFICSSICWRAFLFIFSSFFNFFSSLIVSSVIAGLLLLRLVGILTYLIRNAVIRTSVFSHCNYLPKYLIITVN